MANMSLKKNPMPSQDPNVRNKNFDEVALGYTEEQALDEAQRCLHCKNKPCMQGCPVMVHIPDFIAEVAKGDFEAAYQIIAATSALPAVCGRVCPQESQCEKYCVRGIKGEPVGIGRLERFVADWHREHASGAAEKPASNGHRVAVVGSGPSGLTCAGDLARKGYDVTVFEALHLAGGVLVYGIPEFRLPKTIVQKEVDGLKELGVTIATDTVIGRTITVDELMEELRQVAIEADGKLMDGTDVAVACLLGAEEFGFATMPLISMGCLMQRDCQQDTCPAGIATQNCRLRRGFRGKPEHVEHFMLFVAEQLREVMASLGFRTVDEMVGHPECLRQIEVPGNRKANLLDLSPVLASATCEFGAHIPGADGRHFLPQMAADSELDKTLDSTLFVPYTADARAHLRPIRFRADIANVNRCVGTILGNAVTKAHPEGLPAGSITIDCDGSAGQSFGAFLPRGITLNVCGDANDYFGKGLSGGEVSVRPNPHATYKFDENIIVGNVAFFGATSGRGFINGLAGQRFAVRNSGATVVVEGCGNHGCEYMTGGLALILGEVGQNFAAGMTGGVAYVFDQYGTLSARVNHESVELKAPTAGELAQVRELIQEHVDATQSPRGIKLLYSFETMSKHFVKVIPTEYERVLAIVAAGEAVGKTHAQAEELAFDIVTGRASAADVARFDVAGGAADTASVAASSVASTKKEA